MKKYAFLAAVAFAALPAQAAQVTAGSSGVAIDVFDGTSRGTLLAFSETNGQALTFAATFRSAVYRNTSGTLDFYYQVARTGVGSTGANNTITSFTAAQYDSFDVFAFRDGTDFDGAGGFSAAFNPPNPPGFTSTAERGFSGNVMGVNFGQNGLDGLEISATYILRTNALYFTSGTFGVIDGSALQGVTFAPSAVPEPATWAMMLGGFAVAGFASRRSRRTRQALA